MRTREGKEGQHKGGVGKGQKGEPNGKSREWGEDERENKAKGERRKRGKGGKEPKT